tara:strand:+ start:86 stop:205 length:120 start_codon:yes stop_codon:yes gene_type:complete
MDITIILLFAFGALFLILGTTIELINKYYDLKEKMKNEI